MCESAIFKAAVKLAPERRAAYLEQACSADPDLRREVESLLRAHDDPDSFLQDPPAWPAATVNHPPLTEGPGTVIGPYKLLQQIGEGGMGVVYMAEQQEPVRRKVALKIIKPGMDSRQVIARFEAERQALAMMDHQNIARVLDAGSTDSGRPYFVMELVHGIPITSYCDDKKLTPPERLQLFVPVCQAVQHAHQKGIIHRDLKPSNILVTMYDDKPVPKVIDFGVAKAVEQRLTEKTLFTQFGTLVGTFEYMSPEQAELNAFGVDTRSDIYSLGVLLYELLTGTTPLERQRLREAEFGEIVRLIKEEDPPRPSTRLSSSGAALAGISQQRGSEPDRLTKLVRGELDWIVMRCLEKDRTRRYETANGLARDVERYLKDEPVEACPPTAGYKLRKFARKHRSLLGSAAAFAALLLLGVAGSTWQAVRATQAEQVADANALEAQDKEREANQQRDEVKALNEKLHAALKELQATQDRLRSTLYAAQFNLAQHAWEADALGRTRELLEQLRPKPGESDLRGFEWHYLNRLCHAELLFLKGHKVRSVAYSPDGKRLASAGEGAKVWDVQTGRELSAFKGHKDTVLCVAFSLDGKRIVSAAGTGQKGEVKVWDAQTGEELLSLKVGNFTDVVFSPDGTRLATASVGDFVKKAFVGRPGEVKVWDARTGQELLTLKGGGGGLAFSPDGELLASFDSDNTVKVWNAQTGQQLHSLHIGGSCKSVTFSPDGKRLAAAANMGGIKVWDSRTGKQLLAIEEGTGDRSLSGFASVAFSPDGLRLAAGSRTLGSLREVSLKSVATLWDAQTSEQLATLKGHGGATGLGAVAFSPDGKHLVAVGGDMVSLWNVQPLAYQVGAVAAFSLSPDGKSLATAALNRDQPEAADVTVWDTQTGRQLHQFRLVGVKKSGGIGQPSAPAVRLGFSPDGRRLAGTVFEMAKVWDTEIWREVATIKGKQLAFSEVAFDGKRLALNDGLREVNLWDVKTAQKLTTLKNDGKSALRITAFSPDGTRLVGYAESKAIVWDAQTGVELLVLSESVTGLAFSPDGKRLAGIPGNAVKTVKMWDAQTGKELLTLKGHTEPVQSVVFSPDGRRLVSTTDKKTAQVKAFKEETTPEKKTGQVKVWNAESGEELLTLQGQGPMAFSMDGHRLFGRMAGGTVKIWDATPLPEKR